MNFKIMRSTTRGKHILANPKLTWTVDSDGVWHGSLGGVKVACVERTGGAFVGYIADVKVFSLGPLPSHRADHGRDTEDLRLGITIGATESRVLMLELAVGAPGCTVWEHLEELDAGEVARAIWIVAKREPGKPGAQW